MTSECLTFCLLSGAYLLKLQQRIWRQITLQSGRSICVCVLFNANQFQMKFDSTNLVKHTITKNKDEDTYLQILCYDTEKHHGIGPYHACFCVLSQAANCRVPSFNIHGVALVKEMKL